MSKAKYEIKYKPTSEHPWKKGRAGFKNSPSFLNICPHGTIAHNSHGHYIDQRGSILLEEVKGTTLAKALLELAKEN